jgi:hypothetical protein
VKKLSRQILEQVPIPIARGLDSSQLRYHGTFLLANCPSTEGQLASRRSTSSEL